MNADQLASDHVWAEHVSKQTNGANKQMNAALPSLGVDVRALPARNHPASGAPARAPGGKNEFARGPAFHSLDFFSARYWTDCEIFFLLSYLVAAMSWELTIESCGQRWACIDGNSFFWSEARGWWIECMAPSRVVDLFTERVVALAAFRE